MNLTKELDKMIEKFPMHRVRIIQLYCSNEDFKSLCDDYWISVQSLFMYRKNLTSDLKLTKEYDAICALLEEEVLNYLNNKTQTPEL